MLGIHTGGALLAPLAARILGVGQVEFVRVKRYAEDVYSVSGVGVYILDEIRGKHDQK